MENKDILIINQIIIKKIINQIFMEQSSLFTKKNYLKAKNDENIELDFNDNKVNITLSINEDYIIDQKIFGEIINKEIKDMVELFTNYSINNIVINFIK